MSYQEYVSAITRLKFVHSGLNDELKAADRRHNEALLHVGRHSNEESAKAQQLRLRVQQQYKKAHTVVSSIGQAHLLPTVPKAADVPIVQSERELDVYLQNQLDSVDLLERAAYRYFSAVEQERQAELARRNRLRLILFLLLGFIVLVVGLVVFVL